MRAVGSHVELDLAVQELVAGGNISGHVWHLGKRVFVLDVR